MDGQWEWHQTKSSKRSEGGQETSISGSLSSISESRCLIRALETALLYDTRFSYSYQ